MNILRFGILTLFGITFIIFALWRKKNRKLLFSSPDFIKTNAIIKEIKLITFVGRETINSWNVLSSYKIDGKEITSLSKNSIHSNKDYKIGDEIEIIYNKYNPENYYLLDDKGNAVTVENGFLSFGIFVCVLSIILMIIYNN